MVRLVGFEPTRLSAPPPQDGVSAVPPQPHNVVLPPGFEPGARANLALHEV